MKLPSPQYIASCCDASPHTPEDCIAGLLCDNTPACYVSHGSPDIDSDRSLPHAATGFLLVPDGYAEKLVEAVEST